MEKLWTWRKRGVARSAGCVLHCSHATREYPNGQTARKRGDTIGAQAPESRFIMKHQAISQNIAEAIAFSLAQYAVDFDGITLQIKVNADLVFVVDDDSTAIISHDATYFVSGGIDFEGEDVNSAVYLASLELIDAVLSFEDSVALAFLGRLA